MFFLAIVTGKVSISSSPSFEKELKDQTAIEGTDVIIKCKAVGDPTPTVIWTKDGKKLRENPRIDIFTKDNWCYLTIQTCVLTDAGRYMCTATNTSGSKGTTCMLTVTTMKSPSGLTKLTTEAKDREPYAGKDPHKRRAYDGKTTDSTSKKTGPTSSRAYKSNVPTSLSTGIYERKPYSNENNEM